jgi:hypothetical protein
LIAPTVQRDTGRLAGLQVLHRLADRRHLRLPGDPAEEPQDRATHLRRELRPDGLVALAVLALDGRSQRVGQPLGHRRDLAGVLLAEVRDQRRQVLPRLVVAHLVAAELLDQRLDQFEDVHVPFILPSGSRDQGGRSKVGKSKVGMPNFLPSPSPYDICPFLGVSDL